jgi:hypothetical protein
MEDQDFVEQFESCALPPSSFHHKDHVRLAWLYLRRYSVLEALTRFSDGLKRFAAHNGKSDRYHETITWAYIFLINERMKRSGEGGGWQEFAEKNTDLFDWKENVLKHYYSIETLQSDLAKRVFILPDKTGMKTK